MNHRPPAVAGKFYPSDPVELHQQIAELIRLVNPIPIEGRVKGIVSPHAGYIYSGLTAAHGYSTLHGEDFDVVVVVSPSHWDFFHGASVHPGDAFDTPLGSVEIDAELRDRLLKEADFIIASETGHRAEHALEVQLPFLQELLPPFTLLPVVIGDQRREICMGLGEAIAKTVRGKNALLVASTDLSHYHESSVADAMDEVVINDIQDFDFERLMRDLETDRTQACGGGPTVAVMCALKHLGVTTMKVLRHSNSGDVTGDYSSVVGYLSAIAY